MNAGRSRRRRLATTRPACRRQQHGRPPYDTYRNLQQRRITSDSSLVGLRECHPERGDSDALSPIAERVGRASVPRTPHCPGRLRRPAGSPRSSTPRRVIRNLCRGRATALGPVGGGDPGRGHHPDAAARPGREGQDAFRSGRHSASRMTPKLPLTAFTSSRGTLSSWPSVLCAATPSSRLDCAGGTRRPGAHPDSDRRRDGRGRRSGTAATLQSSAHNPRRSGRDRRAGRGHRAERG